jgi:hypothetical protein
MTMRFRAVQDSDFDSPQKLDAASLRFIGSLIQTDQHPSWYGQWNNTEITAASMPSSLLGTVFAAINKAIEDSADFNFTPRAIAEAMLSYGLYPKGDDVDLSISSLASRLSEIGTSGARSVREFRRIEGLMIEAITHNRLLTLPAEVARIMAMTDASSLEDRFERVSFLIDELKGEFTPQSRRVDAANTTQVLTDMNEERRALIGLVPDCFPRHFGSISTDLKPKRKQMVVISGPTGGGKSILTHMWAEFLRRLGRRVLFLLTEDDVETTLMRAMCRQISMTTFRELDESVDNPKFQEYASMVEEWKTNGGEIVYEECAGMTPKQMRRLIERRIREGVAESQPYDAVFMDYFQDADFDTEAAEDGTNRVAVAGRFAVQLRALAVKHNLIVCVASQETEYGDDVKTAWSKRLTEKAQIWLRFVTVDAKEAAKVYLRYYGPNDARNEQEKIIAQPGEALPFMYLIVQKANRGAKGKRVVMYRHGQRQHAYEIEWYRHCRKNPTQEWDVPVFEPIDPGIFRQRQYEGFQIADATIEQIDAASFDPARQKAKGGNRPPM